MTLQRRHRRAAPESAWTARWPWPARYTRSSARACSARACSAAQLRPKLKRPELKPPDTLPDAKPPESDAPLPEAAPSGPVDGFLSGAEGGTGHAAPAAPPQAVRTRQRKAFTFRLADA
jgi:hypothetical protein